MKNSVLVGLLGGLLLTSAAFAQTDMAPAASARPLRALTYLKASDVLNLLPAPPVQGDDVDARNLREVQDVYRKRSKARAEQAAWDDAHEDVSLFAATLEPDYAKLSAPRTAELIGLVAQEEALAATVAKKHIQRLRPWAEDETIRPCDYKPGANPRTSYPSGHGTLGYGLAYLLSVLTPQKARAIQDRASDYAYSRIVCGDHFASDLEASHVLGVYVAMRVLADPRVAPLVQAAVNEQSVASK